MEQKLEKILTFDYFIDHIPGITIHTLKGMCVVFNVL